MKVILIFLLITQCSASLKESLQNSLEEIITTAIEKVSVSLENGEADTTRDCSVSATVSCKVTETGEDCEDLVVPLKDCNHEEMTFTFNYCNNNLRPIELLEGRTINVNMFSLPPGSMAYINAVPVDINLQDLPPKKCWTVTKTVKVNTCWKMINSSLKIEGWLGEGNYCYAWAFYRRFIKRPQVPRPSTPCAVSSQVSCVVNRTGQKCDEYTVPYDSCGDESVTFTFEYCNDESEFAIELRRGDTSGIIDMSNLPTGTMAFIHDDPVEINMSDLMPGRCRTIKKSRTVNTCWDSIDGSLKIEGWRGGERLGDFCYDWNFYRATIKRPGSCAVSSHVSCEVSSTGLPCSQHVVPLESCRNEEMTFSFEMCNYERRDISLRQGNISGEINMSVLPPGTMAFIHKKHVEINFRELPAQKCRTVRATRAVNTCWKTIDASLKVEGWRGNGEDGDYCYAWDFYRTTIKRPQIPPPPCDVSAAVSCTVNRTGRECNNLVVPLDNCGDEDLTFTFTYCSLEPTATIRLREGNTSGNIDMESLPPGTMAFIHTQPVDFDLSDLPPGKCRTVRETKSVNTCWKTIDASLKVEGWRGNGEDGDYCYAWDFYRSNIKRPDNTPPTRAPSPSCAVRSEVSCTQRRTGFPCDYMIIPFDKCGEEELTFTFTYCSLEPTATIRLREGNTSGNIDMESLPPGTMAFIHTQPVDFDLSDLPPGKCRTVRETKSVNTCWKTIDASLKVEGWRGNGEDGDYCFAWDFYRSNIKRPDNYPTLSPTHRDVLPCEVSSKVSCQIDRTGDLCEDLITPLSECGREAMTFTFEYCNNEVYQHISLIQGDTSGNIDMKNLPRGTMAFTFKRPVALDLGDLLPGQCKTIVERRTINSCRPTIEASLKVEGWYICNHNHPHMFLSQLIPCFCFYFLTRLAWRW